MLKKTAYAVKVAGSLSSTLIWDESLSAASAQAEGLFSSVTILSIQVAAFRELDPFEELRT